MDPYSDMLTVSGYDHKSSMATIKGAIEMSYNEKLTQYFQI